LTAPRSRFYEVAIEATIPAASQQKEKHMIIGTFNKRGDDIFAGSIGGIGFNIPYVVFMPAAAEKTGNRPDFSVHGGRSEEEGTFELGAAWRKTSKKGKAYLSVKLDSPALNSPINCALTQQQDGSHVLVWNRKEAEVDEAAAA
jgi:uncharacterized protein (DUF736 family)